MEKLFADYETSRMLKRLGFNEPCLGYYVIDEQDEINNVDNPKYDLRIQEEKKQQTFFTLAPTHQQIKIWLWEKYGIWFQFYQQPEKSFIVSPNHEAEYNLDALGSYDSPVEAEIEGIKKAIEYLHKEKSIADKNLFPPISEIK